MSDAHSTLEVGVAYNVVDGDPSTPEGLLAALTNVELVPGRASYIVRTLTPDRQAREPRPGEPARGPAARGQRGPPHE